MPAMTKAELAAENEALRKSLSREVAKRERLERRCAAKNRHLTEGAPRRRPPRKARREPAGFRARRAGPGAPGRAFLWPVVKIPE